MGLTITNNVAALTAQNNLARTSGMLSKTLERLSSGLKINRGADGPAALVISEEQRAQIAGLQAAINNTSKGVSMVQSTEGALNEINNLLVQIRGLALDSANTAVNDANAQAANQAQVTNALATIDRIAQNTQFGTKKVLDGSTGLTGSTTNPSAVSVLKATADAAVGAYQVNITTAAQRAFVVEGAPQLQNLANAETLTINGVQVSLTAGSSQTNVRDTINSFTSQTGVTAETINAGTQSNGTATAAAVLYGTTALTAAGPVAATTGTQINNLTQVSGGTFSTGDTLKITGTKADGTAIATTTYTFANTTDKVDDLLTSVQGAFGAGYTATITRDGNLEVRNNTAGSTAALALNISISSAANNPTFAIGTFANNGVTTSTVLDSTYKLNDLQQGNGRYGAGDVLVLTGTKSDGTAVSTNFTLTATANKVSDVVGALQTAFGSNYTAGFAGGKFFVLDTKDPNAGVTTFQIADQGTNVGNEGAFFGAGTSTTTSTALRLQTTNFGAAAKISVQSNQVGNGTSAGIGTAIQTASGVDVVGNFQVGSSTFSATGQGNVLYGNASDGAKGIYVQVNGLDTKTNAKTQTGLLGTVTIADNSLVFQIGANASQTAKIAVDNASSTALGLGVAGSQFTNLNAINVTTQSGSQDSLKVIDQAISDISNLRGRLGAFQQQTLESTANNLRTTLENTTSAESVIRDTDFAAETANFTKFQVLIQAGTTVLSNANQTSQLVLSLLQGR
jgi:flagellin